MSIKFLICTPRIPHSGSYLTKIILIDLPVYLIESFLNVNQGCSGYKVGRIFGRKISSFLYPVSGQIPNMASQISGHQKGRLTDRISSKITSQVFINRGQKLLLTGKFKCAVVERCLLSRTNQENIRISGKRQYRIFVIWLLDQLDICCITANKQTSISYLGLHQGSSSCKNIRICAW